MLALAAGDEYFLLMTAKDTKKGSVYYNVSADVSSLKDAPADALAMPETDCLAVSDARSFGLRETDALADVSAGFPAGLDDKFGWRDLMLA